MVKKSSSFKLSVAPPPSVQEFDKDDKEDHTEQLNDEKEEEIDTLPPFIVTNPRAKIQPEPIPLECFVKTAKKDKVDAALMWIPTEKIKKEPVPKYPHVISWWPKQLCFKLANDIVIKKLSVCNRSKQNLIIQCWGLWNDQARLGAGWQCYPRTRMYVAPGLSAEIFIRAHPREVAPVPYATAGLQLVTGLVYDAVMGYFVVPIGVTFDNFIPIPMEECEPEHINE